ncbi:MAG: hypothetical protein AAFR47_11225 [Pseudomonadota bacterium]
MMLTELTAVPTVALPVFQFRDHLKLGTGFADDGAEDGLLETYLRAALAAVEAWTGKALITRDFMFELTEWRQADAQALPVAPVTQILSVAAVDSEGAETVVPADRYRLVKDTHRPFVRASSACLPTIPTNGSARVHFYAGFGSVWTDVPADLAHAVIMLAAYYHEYRHEARIGAAQIPYGVSCLIAGWRVMRLRGGGLD